MGCPECEKSTAGICREHIKQAGHWTWYPTPICIACGNPSDFTAIMPYGTGYDGEHLCADCIRSFVDTLIDRMRKERNT